MKAEYDPEADALYVRLSDARIAESEEVRPGVTFDYDAEGRVVGIEFLWARDRVNPQAELLKLAG